ASWAMPISDRATISARSRPTTVPLRSPKRSSSHNTLLGQSALDAERASAGQCVSRLWLPLTRSLGGERRRLQAPCSSDRRVYALDQWIGRPRRGDDSTATARDRGCDRRTPCRQRWIGGCQYP